MAKTFHELDPLGTPVSLFRRTHGGFGENRGDGSRFKSGYGGTHYRCFSIYLEHRFLCQRQRDGCALEVIRPRVDLSGVVGNRDGSFMALLLSSAPTGR